MECCVSFGGFVGKLHFLRGRVRFRIIDPRLRPPPKPLAAVDDRHIITLGTEPDGRCEAPKATADHAGVEAEVGGGGGAIQTRIPPPRRCEHAASWERPS